MTTAIWLGASSGALHAVTGPDHLLSLGPDVVGRARPAWRIGATWGVGHALGTLAVLLPLLWLVHGTHAASTAAALGEPLAGATLLVVSALGLRAPSPTRTAPPASRRAPLVVGTVHGVTGAGALALVLPVVATSSAWVGTAYTLAFSVGGVAAMALLTEVLARASQRVAGPRVVALRRVASAAGVVLGGVWLVRGLISTASA